MIVCDAIAMIGNVDEMDRVVWCVRAGDEGRDVL